MRRLQRFLGVSMIALYTAQVVWGKDLLSWSLGLVVGAIAALWLWLRDSPPPHIERWRTGRDAERRTARALKPLTASGWTVVHDVAAERGNRDHVLVGPGGVFLVDTKELSRTATVNADTVRVERPDNPRATYEVADLAGRVRSAAADLSRELRRLSGERVWVHAVVVCWNDFPAGTVEADRLTFVAGRDAEAWFGRQPERLSSAPLLRLKAAVAALPSAV